MAITVYADFNCPYSALASWRLDRSAGGVEFEFRAVEHDAGIPLDGRLPEGVQDEVDEVLGLVTPADGDFMLEVPDVMPNTATMCAAYAADPTPELRRALFDAIWRRGPAVELTATDADKKDEWQAQWDAFGDKKVVPLLVLEDGYVSRGLGALKRLADITRP